jgi:hypothetical protein
MWSNLTLCTDADLGAIEPLAIASGSPWGAVTWASARAEAKREIKVWIEMAFGKDTPNPADRILDLHAPAWVVGLNGSTYTDYTALAINRDEDDLDLTTIFNNAANRLYLGCDYQFDGVSVLMKLALNAQARVLTTKYAGPTGFTAISGASDGTAVTGKTFAQSGRITWTTTPTDWQRQLVGTVSAEPLYWVELSVDTALSAGSTKAAQILTVRTPDGLRRVAQLLSLAYVLNGLERQSAKPKDWAEKSAGYRAEAVALWQALKENGGIPLDTNRDNVIERREIVATAPLRIGRA